MAQELTEELKVFVTAEVDKAIKGLKDVDKQTRTAEQSFKVLGKSITTVFLAKELVSFAKQSVNAWETQKQAVSVLNATLVATGANAWTSSKQLQEMASSLQKITNYSDETIIQMQSVLLGFKNIKGDTFSDATKAILDMATVMKMDLSSAAQAVGKALDDPINGITSLQRQGFRFSESQKDVIQNLIDAGDTAAAQKIIIDELNSTYGGAAEAAIKASAQIKNAWGDMLEEFGKIFSGGTGKSKIASALEEFTQGVDLLYKRVQRSYNWEDFYNGLSESEKLEEATLQLRSFRKELHEAKKEKDRLNAQSNVDWWSAEVDRLKQAKKELQEYTGKQNELIEAQTSIKNLMHVIGLDYEKLSKDDPVVQLENYQRQLEKIAKDKETLSLNTTGLDTTKAVQQLDYNAEVIRSKIKEIQDKLQNDGKKSWQKYFEEITGVSASTFTTGKQAGNLYVQGLQKAFEQSENITGLLGKKFDAKAAIEDQMAELESTITNLLNIPADQIDEAYSAADDNIKVMIEEYKRLNEEKKQFEVTGALDELNEKVVSLTKTERDLFITKLESNNATEEQIRKANELFDEYEKAQKEAKNRNKNDDEDGFISWENSLEQSILSGVEKLGLFKENAEEANKTIASLGAQLTSLSFNSVISGAKELGKALGEGKTAGDSLQQAMANMGQEILNQLPMLFLQAGLQLIAQGQWPLGLGLIGGGLSSAVVSGFTDGRLEENARGGVYGDVSAFAKGGTFSNEIVNRPTLFKFARGGKMGTGLMGEAGPEAIMPLKRGSDGSLGVMASGGETNILLAVEINNYTKEEVQAREVFDENGNKRLLVMIGNSINAHISSGKADKALANRYGLRAQGV